MEASRGSCSNACLLFFAGGDGERLCSTAFPVSPQAPAGPRTLVLLPTGQHDFVLLLQKCRMHLLAHRTRRPGREPEQTASYSLPSCVPADVRRSHILVSVLLWILGFSHDRPVVSDLLQLDVLCLPSTHHWHSGQRRVSGDSPTSTSALCERPEL